MIAPAMPVVMQKGKVFIGLFGLAVNSEFNYPKYFAMIPSGPGHQAVLHRRASSRSRRSRIRSRRRSRWSPPTRNSRATPAKAPARTPRRPACASSTTRPIRPRPPTSRRSCARSRRPIRTSSSVCSYPLNSVGMVKAVNEIGFKPKMIGGAMVGLQATVFKTQLGPLLNGWINYETWVPSDKMLTPERQGIPQEVPGARRRPKASIRSAIISAPGAMPISSCSAMRSTAPRASTTTRSPTTSAQRPRSRPSWATSSSARVASGPSRACCRCSITASRATTVDQFKGMDTQTVLTPADLQDRQHHLSLREGEVVRRDYQVCNGPGCGGASGTVTPGCASP